MTDATVATTDTLAGLNDAQRRAAAHRGAPIAVLAGPGTGKTRVIIHRVASLIQDDGADPASILAVTYTVRAADELRRRLATMIGGPAADRVNAFTFHGFGRRLLLRFRDLAGYARQPMLMDSAQRLRAMRSVIASLELSDATAARGWAVIADEALARIARFKNNAVSPARCAEFAHQWQARIDADEWDGDERLRQQHLRNEFSELASLYQRFNALCRTRSWVTYEDLIGEATRLLDQPRVADIIHAEIRHVVVDEFQDVNLSQIELLRRVAPPGPTTDLCVVGDDDQSIYLFRDSDDLAFKRFAAIWSGHETVELTDNYRATDALITVTNSVIARAHDRFRPDKRIVPARVDQPHGPPVECVRLASDHDGGVRIAAMVAEARNAGENYKDMAVIARTHGDLDRIGSALRVCGIPVQTARRHSAADDPGVKDVLAWIELLVDPNARHAARRLLIRPPLAMDSQQLARLETDHRAEASRAALHPDERPGTPSFVQFIKRHADDHRALAAFSARYDELHELASHTPAYDVVFRIITLTGVAFAELLAPPERAVRVANLVTLLRFVHDRMDRLDPPADLAAFRSYYDDLDAQDQSLRDAGRDRVDGDSEEDARFDPSVDAVRLLTAHSSKGLEFDTVYVPRVSPGHGYPLTSGSTPDDLPDGLVPRQGDPRDAKARRLAEERRVFYVACTRARRRLVLLTRKTKTPSASIHFLQEITSDPTLSEVVREIDDDAGAPRRPADQSPSPETINAQRDVLDRARDTARTSAADALHAADDPNITPEALDALSDRLRDASARLAVAAHIDEFAVAPDWAAGVGLEQWAESLVGATTAAPVSRPLFEPVKGPLRLSYTHVQQYLDCPRCYYARYVLRVPESPSAALQLGTVVHVALERFYRRWMDADASGAPTPGLDEMLDIGRRTLIETAPFDATIEESMRAQVEAQLRLTFHTLHSAHDHVLAVESRVVFPFVSDGVTHRVEAKLDRIDRTDAGFSIIDYKTGAATKTSLTPARADLQLGIYALALPYHFEPDAPEPPPVPAGSAEYWLLSTGQRGSIGLSDLDLGKVRSRIETTIAGITAGRFDKGKSCRHLCDLIAEPATP